MVTFTYKGNTTVSNAFNILLLCDCSRLCWNILERNKNSNQDNRWFTVNFIFIDYLPATSVDCRHVGEVSCSYGVKVKIKRKLAFVYCLPVCHILIFEGFDWMPLNLRAYGMSNQISNGCGWGLGKKQHEAHWFTKSRDTWHCTYYQGENIVSCKNLIVFKPFVYVYIYTIKYVQIKSVYLLFYCLPSLELPS